MLSRDSTVQTASPNYLVKRIAQLVVFSPLEHWAFEGIKSRQKPLAK